MRRAGAIAAALLLVAQVAWARQVYPKPLETVLGEAKAVLVVEVIDSSTRNDKCGDFTTARYRVVEALKGTAPEEKERVIHYTVLRSGVEGCGPEISYAYYETGAKPPYGKGLRLVVFVGAQAANSFDLVAKLDEVRRIIGKAK